MIRMATKSRKLKDQLCLIRGDVAELLPCTAVEAETITAGPLTLPREGLREYPMRTGGSLFLATADLPALIQAEEIARLKRSAILRAVFDSGTEKGASPWPWLVVIAILGVIAMVH